MLRPAPQEDAVKEAQICSEIVNSINAMPEGWVWKIPDASPRNRTSQRYLPARAFDIVACVSGKFVAIEVKLVKGTVGLSSDRLTGFEAESLTAVDDAYGLPLIACAYFSPPGSRAGHLRELWLIPWPRWALAVFQATGKTVSRKAIVEEFGTGVEWAGKGQWKIGPVLEEMLGL